MTDRGKNRQGSGMTSQRSRDRLMGILQDKGIQHAGVLQRMRHVPRHLFLDEALALRAYEDEALPIGQGQTISQPFVVARMTELLLDQHQHFNKVLEIGTGSGYQAAVLAGFCDQLHTIERIETLYRQTRSKFFKLGYKNIRCYLNNGAEGLEDHAPFDAIMITAATEIIPPSLVEQLVVGGRLVCPIGQTGQQQQLLTIVRESAHNYSENRHNWVNFVPLINH